MNEQVDRNNADS